MKMKNLAKTITAAVLLAALVSACGGSKTKTGLNADGEEATQAADSLAASAVKTKEDSTLPVRKEQYLTVKFRQNDAEVEMVLDPHSTNLALDMKRGKDGYFEVMKGDSSYLQKGQPGNSANKDDRLLTDKAHSDTLGRFDRDLTEEIVSDINLAQRLFYERRYEEALQVLQNSIAKKRTASAYALGGSIYFVNGQVEAAVRAWENALQINPNLEQVRTLVQRYKN